MWLGMNVILQLASVERRRTDGHLRLPAPPVDDNRGAWAEFPVIVDPQLQPWNRAFEALMLAMDQDGRVYLEGDGAFVLCGTERCSADNHDTIWLGKLPKPLWQAPTLGWRPIEEATGSAKMVWRIEGNVVDGALGVDHVTINGTAPRNVWREFLHLLQGDPQPTAAPRPGSMVAQLHQFGLYVGLDSLLQ